MPKTSKTTATQTAELPGFEGRYENVEGYTIETYTEDADLAPPLQGSPR
jgi:hypothetical protein